MSAEHSTFLKEFQEKLSIAHNMDEVCGVWCEFLDTHKQENPESEIVYILGKVAATTQSERESSRDNMRSYTRAIESLRSDAFFFSAVDILETSILNQMEITRVEWSTFMKAVIPRVDQVVITPNWGDSIFAIDELTIAGKAGVRRTTKLV